MPFDDGIGQGGLEDVRSILWLTFIMVATIVLYKFCKNNKIKGKKIIKILMVIMITLRVIVQIVKSVVGYSLPKGRDLIPGQMCTILIYLLPLTILFDWKKIKTPVFVLSMMGALMTFLINDYFNSSFLSFYTLEGMWAHTMLWVVPIAMIGLDEFKLEFKKIWQIVIAMLLLMVWATFLNKVLFKSYNPNYLYLERNMLPGQIGGKYFFFIYAIIFFILLLLFYILPILYKKMIKILIGPNTKLKDKIDIIFIASILLLSGVLMIQIKAHQVPKLNSEKKSINLAIMTTMMSEYSVDWTPEQLQKRLNRIVGEDKVHVYNSLFGIKVKFLETGNVYNTNDSVANIKATKVKNKVYKILTYILEIVLVVNLGLSITLVCKNKGNMDRGKIRIQ